MERVLRFSAYAGLGAGVTYVAMYAFAWVMLLWWLSQWVD